MMSRSGFRLALVAVGFVTLLVGHTASRAQAPDPDLNDDGIVNILDVSMVGSCFGQDPATNAQCAVADTDGDGDVDTADLNFVVLHFGESGFPTGDENTPPVADAGADRKVLVGHRVRLDGSESSDVDRDLLTLSWSLTAVPTGSAATLSDPDVRFLPTHRVDTIPHFERFVAASNAVAMARLAVERGRARVILDAMNVV